MIRKPKMKKIKNNLRPTKPRKYKGEAFKVITVGGNN